MKLYRRRFLLVYALLGMVAFAASFYVGTQVRWQKPRTQVIRINRPTISPKATLAEVKANFSGDPYVSGQLQELPGFQCVGYTAGNAANDSGWVVIRCQK